MVVSHHFRLRTEDSAHQEDGVAEEMAGSAGEGATEGEWRMEEVEVEVVVTEGDPAEEEEEEEEEVVVVVEEVEVQQEDLVGIEDSTARGRGALVR